MSSPLVSAAWLQEHYLDASAGVRVLDARFKLGQADFGLLAYQSGHIPGAAFVDLERDLSAPVRSDGRGGRHPLPQPAHLAAVFSRLGLKNSDHVVAYDDPSGGLGFYAPHLWWILRYLGHEAVSVLDGGLPTWTAAGGPLETETPAHVRSVFNVQPRAAMIVDADYVQHRSTATALLDSRAPERFSGQVEPLDRRGGHIPGAINMNWADGMQDGRWRAAAEQEQRFAGLKEASEIIVYCGSGVSAGGNLLALEMAGIRQAKLYPGSWSDWISDPTRAIEIGGG